MAEVGKTPQEIRDEYACRTCAAPSYMFVPPEHANPDGPGWYCNRCWLALEEEKAKEGP